MASFPQLHYTTAPEIWYHPPCKKGGGIWSHAQGVSGTPRMWFYVLCAPLASINLTLAEEGPRINSSIPHRVVRLPLKEKVSENKHWNEASVTSFLQVHTTAPLFLRESLRKKGWGWLITWASFLCEMLLISLLTPQSDQTLYNHEFWGDATGSQQGHINILVGFAKAHVRITSPRK